MTGRPPLKEPHEVLVLDGTRFSTLDGFYEEANRLFAPGMQMGRNLDALADVLKGGVGGPEGEFTLVWRSSGKSRKDLSYPETVRALERRLGRCHATSMSSIAVDLERARRRKGPTAFDWLLEVLRDEKRIALKLE